MIIDHDEPDLERISDESDRASKIELVTTEECIKKVLSGIERAPGDFDGVHCVDCNEPIPEARLKTGAFRDIHCQSKLELKKKQGRGK